MKKIDISQFTHSIYIASVKFVSNPKKTYKYIINRDLVVRILNIYNDYAYITNKGIQPFFIIENENGHNYRNSRVYFIDFIPIIINSEHYLEIIDIKHKSCEDRLLKENEDYLLNNLADCYFEEKDSYFPELFFGPDKITFKEPDLKPGDVVFVDMNGNKIKGKSTYYNIDFGSYDRQPEYNINLVPINMEAIKNNCAVSTQELADALKKVGSSTEKLKTTFENFENLSYNNNTINEKEKEKNSMFENVFNGLKFGKITDGSVKMSVFGPAFMSYESSNNHSYIAYDKSKNTYVDVIDAFINFDYMFEMPVAATSIVIGDFIRHQNKWCRVIDITDNRLEVEKIYGKEIVTVMPITNIFGFDFYQKLCVPFDFTNSISSDQPFGNIIPFMLMSDKNNSMQDMLMFMMLNNGNNIDKQINPLMMMLLMNKDSNNFNNDTLMMMMLMGQNPFNMLQPTVNYQEIKDTGSNESLYTKISNMTLDEIDNLTDMINTRLNSMN